MNSIVFLYVSIFANFCLVNSAVKVISFDPKYVPCSADCINSLRWPDLFTDLEPNRIQFLKWFAYGEPAFDIVPIMKPEKWDWMCDMFTSFLDCFQNCTSRTRMDTLYNIIYGIQFESGQKFACDSTIRENYECLTDLAKEPLESCDGKCGQFKTVATGAVRQYKLDNKTVTNPIERQTMLYKMIHTFSSNLCQFINCQLKCHSSIIAEKCGIVGIVAVKKMVDSFGGFVESFYFQFHARTGGVIPVWTEQCNKKNILDGFFPRMVISKEEYEKMKAGSAHGHGFIPMVLLVLLIACVLFFGHL